MPDERALEAIAAMVLECVHREYPSHVSHALAGDHDARPPRQLTPAFFGCYDWHSAVHGHWCLARLLRLHPGAAYAPRAAAALARSLTPDHVAAEAAYLGAPGREGFERPYGLAWLLQLAAELREWEAAAAAPWRVALEPLERLAAERLASWLPRLRWPVRSGEHGQTAFALGLTLDWARIARDRALDALVAARAREFFSGDVDAPIAYEPSGHDFLSPVLGEADIMRRVLEPEQFSGWLGRLLPDLEGEAAVRWLTPVVPTDRADGKLAHLDGLNLSRAWMLEGIVGALAPDDARARVLGQAASRHRE
ncbi:MAG TPA: DUF2891 domain-containing protein, partial [Candidatus Eisenbacteria bacterium]